MLLILGENGAMKSIQRAPMIDSRLPRQLACMILERICSELAARTIPTCPFGILAALFTFTPYSVLPVVCSVQTVLRIGNSI